MHFFMALAFLWSKFMSDLGKMTSLNCYLAEVSPCCNQRCEHFEILCCKTLMQAYKANATESPHM